MKDKDIENAIDLIINEAPAPAPAPVKTPVQAPVRTPGVTPSRRTKRPSTPIRPTPGVSPKPKAQIKTPDVELFKKART